MASNVMESIVQPDESAIKAHLEVLFAPLREDYPGGLIEIIYGAKPDKAAYFNLHSDGVDDAVVFAASRARAGENIYVGVNPRKPGTNPRGRASDSDVEVAVWQFADIDEAETLDGLGRKLRACPPTYTVNTGTAPHRRPHLYWQLEEPVRNIAQWTERQRGIAATLGSDKAVVNASRIMRLAGSVNFPPQHKLQKGYRVEVVTLKTEFDDEREPVTVDEIATAYPAGEATASVTPIAAGQSTLSTMRPTRIHDLIEACRSGAEWHNNMIRLVAHLAAIGRTSAEILALADHITLPGYTTQQTWRDMENALRGARTKWALPEPQDETVEAEEAVREEADSVFPLLDMDELEAMPPPEWLIHEMVVSDGLTVVYGDPGAGKSFIVLDMALRLALGMDWHGTGTRPTGVLYIAGEGARGLGKRIKGWRREHAMEGVDAPFLLLPIAVELLAADQRAKLLRTIDAAAARAGFEIGLVVVDTVSRALAGGDENGQEAMGAFVAACDAIKRHAGGALIGVHHSGKDKDKGMRGSTVLLGASDGVIRVEKTGEQVTLTTEKQKDAEEVAPIYMAMKKVAWAQGLKEEQSTLVPFRSEAQVKSKETLSSEQIARAFGIITDAWGAGKPLSTSPNTREQGRYAAAVLADRLGCKERMVRSMLTSWLQNDCLEIVEYDKHSKAKGLRVLNPITRNG